MPRSRSPAPSTHSNEELSNHHSNDEEDKDDVSSLRPRTKSSGDISLHSAGSSSIPSGYIRDSVSEEYPEFLLREGDPPAADEMGYAADQDHLDEEGGIFAFSVSDTDEHDNLQSSRRVRRTNFRCIGLATSLVMMTILLALSGINLTWTLNAGESRRINTPILSRQIVVKIPTEGVEDEQSLMADVYNLKSCPPLTGPILTLSNSRNISLDATRYDWDSFYLNAGSSISLNISQDEGQSKVYILEGKNALRRLQSTNTDDDPFGKDSVVEGTTSEGKETSYEYTVKQSDVYTMVYDNPSGQDLSQLHMNYTVVVTTYDLQAFEPQCNKLTERTSCIIDRPDKGSCLLVQADKRATRMEEVTVRVHSNRMWLPILILTVFPYLCGWYAAIYFKPKSPYHAIDYSGDREHDQTQSVASEASGLHHNGMEMQQRAAPHDVV